MGPPGKLIIIVLLKHAAKVMYLCSKVLSLSSQKGGSKDTLDSPFLQKGRSSTPWPPLYPRLWLDSCEMLLGKRRKKYIILFLLFGLFLVPWKYNAALVWSCVKTTVSDSTQLQYTSSRHIVICKLWTSLWTL